MRPGGGTRAVLSPQRTSQRTRGLSPGEGWSGGLSGPEWDGSQVPGTPVRAPSWVPASSGSLLSVSFVPPGQAGLVFLELDIPTLSESWSNVCLVWTQCLLVNAGVTNHTQHSSLSVNQIDNPLRSPGFHPRY